MEAAALPALSLAEAGSAGAEEETSATGPAGREEALLLALGAAAAGVSPLQGSSESRVPLDVVTISEAHDLAPAAAWFLKELDHAGSGALPLGEVAALARARAALGLAALCGAEAYVAATAHDAGGSNALGAESLAGVLGELLDEWAAARGIPASAASTPRPLTPPAPPPSPVEGAHVVLCTLAGDACRVGLVGMECATTEDLEGAVARSPLALRVGLPVVFAFGGRVLGAGDRLQDHAITCGSHVDVVRVTPPPALVRLACEGLGCGPSIRGSCGTFRLVVGRTKNGRPVYVRDLALSSWNAAIRYHGAGCRYLLFEEHPEKGGRWALTDDRDWTGYTDRAYAFAPLTVPHPGYLEGRGWHVYKDSGCEANKTWLEHPSLQLTVEEASDRPLFAS